MAAKDRTTLNDAADTNLPDNSSGAISPADVRAAVKDLIESAFNLEDDDSDSVPEGDTNKYVTPANVAAAGAAMRAPRIGTTASASTITADTDSYDQYNVTALAVDATIDWPGGNPQHGQKLIYRIKDNGAARALTWDSVFRAIGVELPTTTVIGKTLYVGCILNPTDSKWDVVAVAQEE